MVHVTGKHAHAVAEAGMRAPVGVVNDSARVALRAGDASRAVTLGAEMALGRGNVRDDGGGLAVGGLVAERG
jgi:hypothetical protein